MVSWIMKLKWDLPLGWDEVAFLGLGSWFWEIVDDRELNLLEIPF